MSFNTSKSKIISFDAAFDTLRYIFFGLVLDHVDSTKYLAVTLQSDCNPNKYLPNELLDARRHSWVWSKVGYGPKNYWAPELARLFHTRHYVCRTLSMPGQLGTQLARRGLLTWKEYR